MPPQEEEQQHTANVEGAVQDALNRVILQIINNRARDVCFDKCFGSRFSPEMSKGQRVCLAKCMDRMYEAHAITVKASTDYVAAASAAAPRAAEPSDPEPSAPGNK